MKFPTAARENADTSYCI